MRLSWKSSRVVAAFASVGMLLISGSYLQAQEDDETSRVALEDAATETAEERVVVYPDQTEEAAASEELAEQAQVLQLRAGEFGEGRANVMGMYMKELEPGGVIVTEVSAATPAFDAGIRAGDEIVSFDGFEADSYRKWIDGMRKLATDAPEGHTLPIRVLRDGKAMNLRLRKPVSGAPIELPTDDTLQQQITQDVPAGGQMPLQGRPGQPLRDRDGADIVNAPFFGGQFGQRLGGTTDRAMAVIHRIAAPQQTGETTVGAAAGQARQRGLATQIPEPADNAQDGSASSAAVGGQRIGLAGFRNTQSGMLVMLDVGGLQPGNYQVGIEDGGALSGQLGTAVGGAPGIAPPPGRRQTPPPQAVPPNPDVVNPATPDDIQGTEPQRQRDAAGQEPQSHILQPRTMVLAQVTEGASSAGREDAATQGGSARAGAPATGTAQPRTGGNPTVTAPGPRQVRQPNASSIPRQTRDTALLDQQRQRTQSNRRQSRVGVDETIDGALIGGAGGRQAGGGAPMMVPVGVLTVDESGTGRLQQVVEGLQVADVVGQAILIHAQGAQQSDAALPPNLDVGAAPLQQVPTGGQQQQQVGGAPGGAAPPPRADLQGERPIAGVGSQQALQAGAGAVPAPVAGGIIRMIPDHREAGAAVPQQPATSLPATGQELR
jgi:hypothetical protein